MGRTVSAADLRDKNTTKKADAMESPHTTTKPTAGWLPRLVQRLRAGHVPRPADSEVLMEEAADQLERLHAVAASLMRTCYDEANRLANHGSNGLERRVMSHLYDAANEAKEKLNDLRSNGEPKTSI